MSTININEGKPMSKLFEQLKANETNNKLVKIRKEKQCYGCNDTFPVKSEMLQVKALIDGVWWVHHLCRKCTRKGV